MFLIHPKKDKCLDAIDNYISELNTINIGPKVVINLNGLFFCWVKINQNENLHIFQDSIVIGKLSFTEKASFDPIYHNSPFIKIPSIMNGIIINTTSDTIYGHHISNVFYYRNIISDFQLLIAYAENLSPCAESISVMANIGYLPGNITLFSEIKKIPFLYSYSLNNYKTLQNQSIKKSIPDDNKMLDRLIEIIPKVENQFLGMTAGYDSRFVYGVLKKGNINPILLSIQNQETEFLKTIISSLNEELKIIPNTINNNLNQYTLLTDAQIYYTGGNFGMIQRFILKDSLFHSGLFADSILKNTHKIAIKRIGLQTGIYEKLIDLLLMYHSTHSSLIINSNKDKIHKFLLEELSFVNDYFTFDSRKECVNWFYYLNRGIRWSQAVTSDISHFTSPIFLLSDLEAFLYGINSSFWSNMKNDRLRLLNNKILKPNQIYYDNEKIYKNKFINSFHKIRFEYFSRLKVFLKEKHKMKNKNNLNYNGHQSSMFRKYFSNGLEEILSYKNYSNNLKRTAITINDVLLFLNKNDFE